MKPNSVILAPFGNMISPKLTDKICPYFRGMAPATITLYFALVAKSSYTKGQNHFYISKNENEGPRAWNGWEKLATTFGISRATMYRSKKDLMTVDDNEPHAIVEEDARYIKIYAPCRSKELDFFRDIQYIPNEVLEGLAAYVALTKGGGAIILRLYSVLKLMAKQEARFSMAQLVYACGLKDQTKPAEGNAARMAIFNAFMFLAGTGFIEYNTAQEMHGKKMCYVLWPTKFNVPSHERYMAFIQKGEIDDEGKAATERLENLTTL